MIAYIRSEAGEDVTDKLIRDELVIEFLEEALTKEEDKKAYYEIQQAIETIKSKREKKR